MATERTASTMADFFKFRTLGQTVAGRVTRHKEDAQNGTFVVFEPVIIANNGTLTKYRGVAIGLSTDLKMKMDHRDIGKYMSLTFVDTEPSKKGSARKVFKVLELSRDEMLNLNASEGLVKVDDVYRKPASQLDSSPDEDDSTSNSHSDDDF